MPVEGTDVVARVSAEFMDKIEEYLEEHCGSSDGEVLEVMVVAEVRYTEDDTVYDHVLLKSSTDSRVHQRGLAVSVLECVEEGGTF